MIAELEELNKRLEKMEKQKDQEILALVEILSNATFFGDLKKITCQYAKDGQCSFFVLKNNAKNMIPIVTDCRIRDCQIPSKHRHIELSNITCTFCQITKLEPTLQIDNVKEQKTDVPIAGITSDKETRNIESRSNRYVE
jgi:hypothetical protein